MLPSDIETEDALRHLSFRGADIDLSRRRFLQAVAVGAGSVAATSMFPGVAEAVIPNGPRDGVLLLVNLIGGNDGLNTVVPYTSSAYYAKRPLIAIPAAQVLPLTADVGLHPRLGFLKSQFDAGRLAVVQGVGQPNPDFSHFVSMDQWMNGWGGSSLATTGWLGRFMDGMAAPDVLRAVNLGWGSVPRTLVGATRRGIALTSSPGGFGVDQATWRRESYAAVRTMAATPHPSGRWADAINGSLRDQLDVGEAVQSVFPTDYEGPRRMKEFLMAARLINANIGVRVVSVTIGGFDTHENQLGDHADILGDLNDGLQLFWSELSPYFQARTTSMAWSEFGRRIVGNGSSGTDHGAAGPMFLMGPRVRGGLHGSAPSLTTTLPHDQLAHSVDFRAVYAQVLDRWLNADSTQILGRNYSGLDLFSSTPGDDTATPAPEVTAKPASYVPMTPERLLDTRVGVGAPRRKVGSGQSIAVKLAGVGTVPATAASAVLLNVTVTSPSRDGFLTVWPSGTTQPNASNLNFRSGQTVPNLVMARLGADGAIALYNSAGEADLIGDVVGYFVESGGSKLVPLTPNRVLDTRAGSVGALGAEKSFELQIGGKAGVPTSAQAVVMNLTAIDPTADSFLTVWPSGQSRPNASNLNFAAGQTVPNLVVAKLGTGGRVSVFNSAGTVHLAADVVGYFSTTAGAEGVPMKPVRLLDTRVKGGKVGAKGTIDVVVAGVGGIPDSGVAAVAVNVTAVDPSEAGFLTVWPAGEKMPTASSLNFRRGQTVPNLVMAKVGANNKISLYNESGSAHLIVDVCGYYLS